MLNRRIPLIVVALALALILGRPLTCSADDKAHEGKVVKAGDGKLTMTMKGETKKHTHDVAADAKITVDGKDAKLEDLKAGQHIKVVMDDKHTLTKIEAHNQEEKDK